MKSALDVLRSGVMSSLAYVGFLRVAGDPVPARVEMVSAIALGIGMMVLRFFFARSKLTRS